MGVIRHGFIALFNKLNSSSVYRNFIPSPDVINRLMQYNISTCVLHQKTFCPFKGINAGKDIAVVATGPSALKYKPKEGCLHIGLNHAYRFDHVIFDYFFVQDGKIGKEALDQINAYRKGKCLKFYGLAGELLDNVNFVIPESDALAADALRYRTDLINRNVEQSRFTYDLSTQPLGDFGSIAFAAIQFALWTNPRRIYLVGCDCSGARFIDKNLTRAEFKRMDKDHQRMKQHWTKLKDFVLRYYPETEIVSVNPVGLKGMFKDEFQDEG